MSPFPLREGVGGWGISASLGRYDSDHLRLLLARRHALRRVHHRFADRESQPGAARISVPRGVAAIKALEHMRQCSRIDSLTLVPDRQVDPVFEPMSGNCNLRASAAMLQRIQQQVGNQQSSFVRREGNRKRLLLIKNNFHAMQLGHRPKLLFRLADALGEIHGQRRCTCVNPQAFEARQRQHLSYDLFHPLAIGLALLQSGAILFDAARFHAEQLQ